MYGNFLHCHLNSAKYCQPLGHKRVNLHRAHDQSEGVAGRIGKPLENRTKRFFLPLFFFRVRGFDSPIGLFNPKGSSLMPKTPF
jgi:hypothetical protein